MSIIEKAVGKLDPQTPTNATGDPSATDEDQVRSALDQVEQVDRRSSNMGTPGGTDNGSTGENAVAEGQGVSHEKRVLSLPFARFKHIGMITPDEPRSKIAEEYRRIKRPLLMNIEGRGAAVVQNPNLIMVTSALPGEGKTFSALNLALSIAMEQDKTVLFVDADVSKASACRLIGVPRDSKGLIDVLEKGTDLREVLYQTDIPNLRVLPAGTVHERSTELLASEGMRRLMADLSQRYSDRVIVFDSPPLLPTTEANVLANLVGQVVFVVAANSTSQGAVTEAISHIEGDRVIGLILNKSTARFGVSYGYGYSYEYGYGYGYDDDEKRAAANS